MLWLVGCALVPLVAGGCTFGDGLSRVVEVTPERFNAVVLQSEQPVLVNFYKPG
jgi:thioredoxin-like negative regulator of GroEL